MKEIHIVEYRRDGDNYRLRMSNWDDDQVIIAPKEKFLNWHSIMSGLQIHTLNLDDERLEK